MDLLFELLKLEYEIIVREIIPFNNMYKVITDQGIKILRKVNSEASRVIFAHRLKEYIFNKGFENIEMYMCTKEDKPYIIYNDQIFTLTDLIEGRQCNFNNVLDLKSSIRNLAIFHNSTIGFSPKEGAPETSNLGRWFEVFSKRNEELIYMKNIASMKSIREDFDNMFLKDFEGIIENGKKAFYLLNKTKYEEISSQAQFIGYVCHNSYKEKNLIFIEPKRVYTMGFEKSKRDIRVLDLAQLILRFYDKGIYGPEIVLSILEEYNSIGKIKKEELSVLLSYITYPKEVCTIAREYYFNDQYSKSMLTRELKGALEKLQERTLLIKFLEEIFL